MPRSRVIKPEFWNDEKLATLSRDSRLTFIGLWTCSDDYGVTKGNPKWLKSQIYPYDDDLKIEKFERFLSDIFNLGLIIPFKYHDELFYYIKNFSKHQKVDHPSKQRNPEPPKNIESEDFNKVFETLATDSREILDETEYKQKQNINRNNGRREDVFKVISYLNEKAFKKFNPDGKQAGFVYQRLQDGATVEQCLQVIDTKCAEWLGDSKWHKYLRPSTLFNQEKFESYLNQKSITPNPKVKYNTPEEDRAKFGL